MNPVKLNSILSLWLSFIPVNIGIVEDQKEDENIDWVQGTQC
jgi:hypothetical protein